jgi:hypothetical protein
MGRLTNSDLSLDDVAQTVAELLKAQRREILEHVERRFVLAETKAAGSHDEVRFNNLHRRITKLESEVRALTRNRGGR